jgi:hypothetical protein
MKSLLAEICNRETFIKLNQPFKNVVCNILKEKSIVISTQSNQCPIVHKNTLGQILYECFLDEKDFEVLPLLFVLSSDVVEGIDTPGIYYLDIEKNCYSCLMDIEKKELNSLFAIGTDLAIGYAAKKKYVKLKDTLEGTLETIQQQINSIDSMLFIHGGLTSYSVNHLHAEGMLMFEDAQETQYVLLFTQWMLQQN